MNREEIIRYLKELNTILNKRDLFGEIYIYGGSALCLTTEFRNSTQDIDAIFHPKLDIYDAAREVALKFNLNEDWLNDGVKGFLSGNNNVDNYLTLSNLIIKVAQLDYIFAMKVLSARTDTEKDFNDLVMLIRLLNLKTIDECLDLVDDYYNRKHIQPKSYYFLQNALETALK